MATQTPPPNSAFLAPRFWPTWLAIGLLSLCAWLPFRLRLAVGSCLGRLTWLLARERRYITEVNIRLCFPELDPAAQAALVRQAFIENGIGLIETATGWIRPARHFHQLCILRGGEQLGEARKLGRGVLLLGGHYSTLDFSANLLSLHYPFAVTYRAHRNPLFDAFMLRGRLRNCNGVFDRKDIRGAFRHLKQNKILWYAPDQDYGPDQAVYAPFFGQMAASITAGSRFAAFNRSPTFMVSHRRDNENKRYTLDIIAIPAAFPSGDDVADIRLINQMLEQEIRKAPAQYLWMHKRFKTQPGGKPQSPYVHISTPNRKLSPDKHAQLVAGATALPGHADRLQLASGLQLWSWPGLLQRWRSHPLKQLDRLSKHLRSHGVATVTLDSLYRFPHLQSSAATVFVPSGVPASNDNLVPPAAVAQFLITLHACGCSFRKLQADNLLWDAHGDGGAQRLAVLDPLALRQEPGSTQLAWRCSDLQQCATALGYREQAATELQDRYLQACRPSLRAALAATLAACRPAAHNAGHPPGSTRAP